MRNNLNTAQQQVVTAGGGWQFCVAGPGTGKTELIAHRIAHVLSQGTPSAAILAVSFSRRAAAELTERVERLMGRLPEGLRISTTHSLGWSLLQQMQPDDPAFNVIGHYEVALEHIDGLPPISSSIRRELAEYFHFCQAEGKEPDAGEFEDHSVPVERIWSQILNLRTRGLITFDQLITSPLDRFRNDPALLSSVAQQYRCVIADEAQDLTRSQLELLECLASTHGNLLLVGDSSQSIYGFRHVDPGYLEHLKSRCQIYSLDVSYRAVPELLALGQRILPSAYTLKPVQPAMGHTPELAIFSDELDEARWISERVADLVRNGVPNDQIAILLRARGGALPSMIQLQLITRGIPYHFPGMDAALRDDPFFSAMLAALNCAMGLGTPFDWSDLFRLIPGISAEICAALFHGDDWERLDDEQLTGKQRAATASVYEVIGEIGGGCGASEALSLFCELYQQIVAPQQRRRLLGHLKHGFHVAPGCQTVEQLKDALTATIVPSTVSPVRIGTIHGSKGLEWDAVFVPRLVDGYLPYEKAQSPAEMAEEQRLLYVACTRARKRLFLSATSAPFESNLTAMDPVPRLKCSRRVASRFLTDAVRQSARVHYPDKI